MLKHHRDVNPRHFVIPLMGGLGNQLFQLCAGLYVKNMTGRLVGFSDQLLDLAPASYVERRIYGLSDLVAPDERVRIPRWQLVCMPLLSRLANSYFVRESTPSDESLIHVPVRSRGAIGFFQRDEYVTHVWRDLMQRMNRSTSFSQVLLPGKLDTIVVHVRRGDYLNSHTKRFHGLTDIDYYVRGCKELVARTGCESLTVVSDDIEGAKRQLMDHSFFSRAHIDFAAGLDELSTLATMASATGVVASNSSFSWWGGRLCWANGGGNVVVPKPWFATEGSADTFMHPNDDRWLVLNRELIP